MLKITIIITEDSNTIITYQNDKTVYPICNIDNKGFHISKSTSVVLITLIAITLCQCGRTLKYQLNKQRLAFNSVFKLSDDK